jgi:hypothetical protein
MKIGKYMVDAHATGSRKHGFQVSVVLTWDEGNDTKQLRHDFENAFPTVGEASKHAYEQVHLRIQNGDW